MSKSFEQFVNEGKPPKFKIGDEVVLNNTADGYHGETGVISGEVDKGALTSPSSDPSKALVRVMFGDYENWCSVYKLTKK